MNNMELEKQLFETILKAAVKDDYQRELDAMPTEEVLRKEYDPSPELDRKIQKMIKKSYHQSLLHKAAKAAQKVALIIAIIIPISLVSLLSVEATRIAIFNSVMEWKSDHVDIFFQDQHGNQPAQNSDELNLWEPQYLPNGFIESNQITIGPTYRIQYLNKNKTSIVFDQTPLTEGSKFAVDTDNTIYKEITIHDGKAKLFAAKTPNDKTYLLWQNSKTSFMLTSTINQEELIKMAESTEIEKN